MKYLSAKETSEKWNISRQRVITLASGGSIPGAQLVGSTWIIPEDASKPADGRIKNNNDNPKIKYKFPLYTYAQFGEYGSQNPLNLNKEEQELLSAQLAFDACDFEKAHTILLSLLNKTDNIYIKIGVLYYLCNESWASNRPSEFKQYLKMSQEIFSVDFPHKEDFNTIWLDIDSLYLGNQIFLNSFDIDFTQTYSDEALAFLHCQSFYTDMLRAPQKDTFANYSTHLATIKMYEKKGALRVAQSLNLYTAFICLSAGLKTEYDYHLRRAIDIGIDIDSFYILAVFYSYVRDAFEHILSSYCLKVQDKIRFEGNRLQKNALSCIGAEATGSGLLSDFSEHEISLMHYAREGLTNKEVSECTGIPEYTIRRHYEKLFKHFNVQNKKALSDCYLEMLVSGYKSVSITAH